MNTNDDTNFSALLERIYFGNGDAFRNEHGFLNEFTLATATLFETNTGSHAFVRALRTRTLPRR
jgi:hypothetical protein